MFFSGIFLFSENLVSQNLSSLSNFRILKTAIKDSLRLDSLSIVPHSVVVIKDQQMMDKQRYTVDETKSIVYFNTPSSDSITIFYRVLPYDFGSFRKSYTIHKKQSMDANTMLLQREIIYKSKNTTNEWIEDEGLTYDGSFYRGITFGNNQGAALHSGFNLNMAGKLNNGLEIVASITDANIPIQPDGNSASLQEFDKIFIQIKKDEHRVTLGDFDVRNINESKFLKFDRKLQGINYRGKIDSNLEIGATAAITRGVFARNIFTATENNQGPYKLLGNNGESFIVIIAGTERVYINGQEMKRGQDNDYIINYNMGEVIFTTKRLITKDLRIVVEFQYSDRNYFRYTLEGNVNYTRYNVKLFSQIFTETDNKNQTINLKLDSTQKQIMREIGNNIENAYVSSATATTWDATKVSYIKIDTTIGSTLYQNVYVWSRSNQSNVYNVVFSYLGEGKGNYVIKSTGANGAVYEFTPPVNGVKRGSYEPSILLPTPKSHLQWTTGGQIKYSKALTSNAEFTYTDRDVNKFSDIDNDKNKGIALRINHLFQKKLDSFKQFSIEQNSEYNSQNFNPVTRYRNLEFNRDWDIIINTNTFYEQQLHTLSTLYNNRFSKNKNATTLYYIPNLYSGIQNILQSQWNLKKMTIESEFNYLYASNQDSTTQFLRPKLNLSYYLNKNATYKISMGLFYEIKLKSSHNSEYLSPSSFNWKNYFFKFSSSEKSLNSFDIGYIYRTEQYSNLATFNSPSILSHTITFNGKLQRNPAHILKWNTSYRRFSAQDSLINTKNEIKNNYLSHIDYNGQILKGLVKLNSAYEIKAGRQQKTQITYVRSPNGYGTHAWKDLNNNGIFELDEAYVSPFALDNQYLRFYNVLPEYVPSNEINWSQFIWIQPKAIWYDQKDIRKFLSKYTYQFRIDMDRKTLTDDEYSVIEYANPLKNFKNSAFIYSRNNLFNQLSYQKNENKVGFDIEWIYSNSRNILSNGVDGVSSNMFQLRSRVEMNRFLTYFNTLSNAKRTTQSEYFKDRNFSFIENQIENVFSFYINSRMKLNINAIYWFKSTGIQYSHNNQGDLELKVSTKSDGILEAKFSTLLLNYSETIKNQQVELSMLNGIQKGTNFIFNLTIGQKITKYLQLNLLYNGRRNSTSEKIIHLANVEVRAIF